MTASIRVWYGARQRAGHLGDAQDDFNLLGEVSDAQQLHELTCLVNGKRPAWPLSVGREAHGFGDGRRLALEGHFNADIPIESLQPGDNQVVLSATWRDGRSASEEVAIVRDVGDTALPQDIDWGAVSAPQDAGHCIDGEWAIQDGGLRTLHSGYDRVFLIGTRAWRDYEALVPVTIHRVDRQTAPFSGGNGIGLLLRFAGHVTGGPRRFPPGQPKWGYQPFGAITWLRFMDGAEAPPQKQFYRGDGDGMTDHGPYPIEEGATYWMRARCETEPDDGDQGVSRYRFRIWRHGATEPDAWDFEERQVSATSLRRGGLALLAHHVDASFGTVSVTPGP